MALETPAHRGGGKGAMRFHATDASGVRRVELHRPRARESSTREVRAPCPLPACLSPGSLLRPTALCSACTRTGSAHCGRHRRLIYAAIAAAIAAAFAAALTAALATFTAIAWRRRVRLCLFRVHLSGIFPGQVHPEQPRSTPTTRADFRGVGRYAAASRARIQRLMPSSPLRLPTHTCPPDPGRCLQPRRHRRQRRQLDGPRSRARCRRLRHRRRPLWRLSRASN